MLFNSTQLFNNSSFQDADIVQQTLRIVSTIVSAFALSISFVSLVALQSHYRRLAGNVRESGELVMILLEMSEVAFCFFATIFFTLETYILHMPEDVHVETALKIQGSMYYPTVAFMGLRNVWIMIMSICRCIAVLKPLWTKIIFTKTRQLKVFGVCATYSIVAMLCVLMVYCLLPRYFSINDLSIVFIINSIAVNVLPMVTVFFTSIIITIRLTSAQNATLAGTTSRKARLNATIITLSIAVSFLILESFGIIMKICMLTPGYKSLASKKIFVRLFAINDTLIALDTISHFGIFFCFSTSFRHSVCFRGLRSSSGYEISRSNTERSRSRIEYNVHWRSQSDSLIQHCKNEDRNVSTIHFD